ncbi:hypothetical protein P4Q63_004469 [Salmonella enterica]|nr:hypothetical protein [Salmonella enterica]EKQ0892877.1 hypothetical protein [Salmonella enterica]
MNHEKKQYKASYEHTNFEVIVDETTEDNSKSKNIYNSQTDSNKRFSKLTLSLFIFFGLVLVIIIVCYKYYQEFYLAITMPILTAITFSILYSFKYPKIKEINDSIWFISAAIKAMQITEESIGFNIGLLEYFFTKTGTITLMILASCGTLKATIAIISIFEKKK